MSKKEIVVAEPVDGDPLAEKRKREQEESGKEGEYIKAGEGYGSVEDPHTSEQAAHELRGRPQDVDLRAIDREWVMRRLVKEATDFGARTRQSARLKAVELIGLELGMFKPDEAADVDPDGKRVREMTSAERRARIAELARDLKVH